MRGGFESIRRRHLSAPGRRTVRRSVGKYTQMLAGFAPLSMTEALWPAPTATGSRGALRVRRPFSCPGFSRGMKDFEPTQPRI